MSGNRPDLHTPQHDQWDQGGCCNSLVTDDDGCGVVCGYRAPSDYTPSLIAEAREYAREGRLAPAPSCGLILALADALEAADRDLNQLAAVIEKVRAEAWDQGWHAGYRDGRDLE